SRGLDCLSLDSVGRWTKRQRTHRQRISRRVGARSLSRRNSVRCDGRSCCRASSARLRFSRAAETRWQLPAELLGRWASDRWRIAHGPGTDQDRWEERPGYSPATIAAEIAGLVCAAEIASINRDASRAKKYLDI